MRMSGWEDFALPLTLVFAVVFALTLRQQIALPSAAPEALAASAQPDYVMTITAKRLPAECRNPVGRAPSCAGALAGEARVEVLEGSARLAERGQGATYAY